MHLGYPLITLTAALTLVGFGVFCVCYPETFKRWTSDHFDRDKTTGEEMLNVFPRARFFDFSNLPTWFYRLYGLGLIAVACTLLVEFVSYLLAK